MSIEDRISKLIWDSEAETVVGVPPRKPLKTKSEQDIPKPPEPEHTRPRPETVYFEPTSEPPPEGSGEQVSKPSVT
jgi:hypothetical protein